MVDLFHQSLDFRGGFAGHILPLMQRRRNPLVCAHMVFRPPLTSAELTETARFSRLTQEG